MCFYIRNVMNYGSIESSGMIPVTNPKLKLENEKAAAKEREKEEKAALKKAKKLKKEAEAQAKKRKNHPLLSESPSKPKHIKLSNDTNKSSSNIDKLNHKSIKSEKPLSSSKSSKPHSKFFFFFFCFVFLCFALFFFLRIKKKKKDIYIFIFI